MKNNYDSIILKYNVDLEGKPVSLFISNEVQQVNPLTNLIQLVQIPDENQRMIVRNEDGTQLHETFDTVLGEDNYRVDYGSGLIHFHESHKGQSKNISYYGRGVELISTNRVFHRGEKGTMEVLHDVIEDAKEAMEVVGSLGGVAETITKLDEKIEEGNTVIDRIQANIEEVEFYGYTITLSREAFVVRAMENGEISKNEVASVFTDIVVYKGNKSIVPTITIEEQNGCEFGVSGQRVSLKEMNIDSIKANATINIDCGDDLIAKRKLEVVKVFDGVVPYVVEMTNSFFSFSADSLGNIIGEQSVTCELSVTKANVEYKNYTILVKNKPSGILSTISGESVTFTCRQGTTIPDNGSLLVVVTIDGKAYNKTFSWGKNKQGASAKSLVLTGGQIFRYDSHDYSGIPSPFRTTLTANVSGLSGTPQWYVKGDSDFELISGQTGLELIVPHDDMLLWNGRKDIIIKCVLEDFSDELSLVKLANGQSGTDSVSIILTNESHTVSIGSDGVVSQVEIDRVKTEVLAYVGTTQTTPIVTKGECLGCDIAIAGNKVQLISLDNSFSTSTAIVHVNVNGIVVPKTLTIAKAKQGETGSSGESASTYILNIIEGTRSFTYSQINVEPRPSSSATFVGNLYIDGTLVDDDVSYYWVARGHVAGVSVEKVFTPSISPTFEESILNNDIELTVTHNGNTISQIIPISVTKDANGLDWVSDWDNTKVEIKGNKLLAPKLFAGEYNQELDTVTGVAIGQNVLGGEEENGVIGIAGYQNNKTTFLLDTDGTLMVGNPFEEDSSGMYYDGEQFTLRVNALSIEGARVPSADEVDGIINSAVDNMIQGVSSSFNDIEERIDSLETEMGEGFKDGILDEIERAKLESIFSSMKTEVEDVRAQYRSTYNNTNLTNQAVKDKLKSDYDKYDVAFSKLENILNTILISPTVTPEQVEDFNSKLSEFQATSSDLKVSLQNAITSISESITTNAVNKATEEVRGEISDVNNALTDLGDTMNGEFKEGLIGHMEIKAVQERIVQLDKEKSDIDGQYEAIFNNKLLGNVKKEILVRKKGDLDIAHELLKSKINSAIIDYIITAKELEDINNAMATYMDILKEYSKIAQECVSDIATNTAQGAVDALDQDAIFNKLTNNGEKQGLYLQDGKLYINGEYVNARNLKVLDNDNNETLKIDNNGNVTLMVTNFVLKSNGNTNVPTVDDVYDKNEVDDKIDEVNKRNMYKVEIVSSNGAIFKNGDVSTTLKAVLYNWDKDVTNEFLTSSFIWTRMSEDTVGDEMWNKMYQGGAKEVVITSNDVKNRATFQVDVLDTLGRSILK